VRLLLDSSVLIFAVDEPERLSKRAVVSLQNPENVLELSAISLVEIAIKTSLGKVQLSVSTVQQALEDLDIRVLPFTGRHALHLLELPPPSQRSVRPADYRAGIGGGDCGGGIGRKISVI
jgi:PIN domain nuclease of toxin-antitoxin system